MRRRTICILAAVLLAGLVLCWVVWPGPRSVRAYDRIRLGMTDSEVEAAIGEAPAVRKHHIFFGYGDSTRSMLSDFWGRIVQETGIPYHELAGAWPRREAAMLPGESLDGWRWEDHEIWVAYDAAGRVTGYYLVESIFRPPTLLERVRAWLGSWTSPPTTVKFGPFPG